MSAPGNNDQESGEGTAAAAAHPDPSTMQPGQQHDDGDQATTSRAPTLAGDEEDIQTPELLENMNNPAATIEQDTATATTMAGREEILSVRTGSGESRRFPLVAPPSETRNSVAAEIVGVEDENPTTSSQPSEREFNLARSRLSTLSTMSGRPMDLDQLFHIRESIQLSIEDPATRVSSTAGGDGRSSHQGGELPLHTRVLYDNRDELNTYMNTKRSPQAHIPSPRAAKYPTSFPKFIMIPVTHHNPQPPPPRLYHTHREQQEQHSASTTKRNSTTAAAMAETSAQMTTTSGLLASQASTSPRKRPSSPGKKTTTRRTRITGPP